MSRHRNVRNLDLSDYLDDDYDDDNYYEEDYEQDDYDDQQHHYEPHDNSLEHFLPQQQSQSQPPRQQQATVTDNHLDEDLLNEMVHQFRDVLNDNTLTSAQVSNALMQADYDWEIALTMLRSAQTVEARQADPSPIARLLSENDDDNTAQRAALDSITAKLATLPPTSVKVTPDYDSFVADSGTALTLHVDDSVNSTAVEPPFQFDKPSPDDIIRAKQARGASRTAPSLRLPKLASGSVSRTVGAVKPQKGQSQGGKGNSVNAISTNGGSAAVPPSSKKGPVLNNPVKPLKLPKPAKPPRQQVAPRANNDDGGNTVVKQRTKKVDLEPRVRADAPSVSVVVAGHVDAGKSTLIGQLMQQVSASSGKAMLGNGRRKNTGTHNLAWDTDEDHVERERGVTIDIAARYLQRPGPPPRTIALIDAPGHRDFVPAMIVGASQASAALLVVDASEGEFEAGFSEEGQTREHAIVLRSFGVTSLIVVVNKMDMVDYSHSRFVDVKKAVSDFLRANGWKTSTQVSFVPVSGRDGVNLTRGPSVSHPMAKWYSGKCLIHLLDACPTPSVESIRGAMKRPTRLVVSDLYRSASLGGQLAVSGRLLAGNIATRDRLLCIPGNALATVKNVTNAPNRGTGANSISATPRTTSSNATVSIAALDATPVSMALIDLPDTGAADAAVVSGSVLCDPEHPCTAARSFRARVLVIGHDAVVLRGTTGVLHVGALTVEAHVSKLCEYVGSSSGGGVNGQKGKKKNNKKRGFIRRLVKGDSAIIEISTPRPVPVETADRTKELSRFALRQAGRTSIVGVVLEVLETDQSVKDDDGNDKNKDDHEQSTFKRL